MGLKSRLTGEAAEFEVPETKEEIIKAIKDSEVDRDVEIDYELTEEIENFPDYMDEVPAKLGFIHPKIVCINIPPVGEFTEPIPDGALSDQELYASIRVGGVEEAEVVEAMRGKVDAKMMAAQALQKTGQFHYHETREWKTNFSVRVDGNKS